MLKRFCNLLLFMMPIVIPIALFVYLAAPGKVHTPRQRGSHAGGAGMF